MPEVLLTRNLWSRITSLVRKSRRTDVAVAWCAAGAKNLLPPKKDSLLVVNLSEEAVKAGQTKPQELLQLVRRGVRIHSVSLRGGRLVTSGSGGDSGMIFIRMPGRKDWFIGGVNDPDMAHAIADAGNFALSCFEITTPRDF